MIRPARSDEIEQLRDIESEAGARFAEVGMPDIANAEPMAADLLLAYARDGRCWVAVDDDDQAIGYVVVDVLGDAAHVEQITVLPRHQSQGVGRALLDEVASWARTSGLTALTLTTFTDVPWNRPLYEHLGFRVLTDDELTPDLRALRDSEATHGLDPATRVCMRRDL